MPIRTRTILVIIAINVVIISFGVLAGIINVRKSTRETHETDLMLISDVADHFISNEIEVLKLKAAGVAQMLAASDDTNWSEILTNLENLYPEFIGMAVLDAGRGRIASAGKLPAHPEILEDTYINQAFLGKRRLSSTIPSTDYGVVFYLAVPMPEADSILAVTLPGMHFSQRLSFFSIWETGHVFISDSEGYAISSQREYWIQDRFNYTSIAETDKAFAGLAETVKRMIRGESGTGYYSVFGVPQRCSFRPISGSEEGWILGAVAPLPENPFRNIDKGLIVVGLVSFFLSVIAAVIASNFIKEPFEEVAALKEAAEAHSKFKSNFIANMSHEIRTPMNAILGTTEILMQDEALEKNMRDGLNTIYNSADMLLNIIDDILDLSKIEAGKIALMPSKYDLASLINDTVMLNMMRVGSKPIEFNLFVDANMPTTLFGDELRIKQILNNLLSNAFKYTDEGVVMLSFAVEEENKEETTDVTLVFSVSDTGQGMTAEQLDALFDEYARFNLQANRAIEGTGLGMSIAQKLLRLMHGEIAIKSEQHKGSIFTVRLPQGRAGSDVLGSELAEKLQNYRLGGEQQIKKAHIIYEPMPYGSVLIVDDVESNLFVAKGLMAPYGLSIDTVTSAYQAIEKIQAGNVYDIVFMDHMMPKMDGMEATKIIREQGYTHPIVALTANAVLGQKGMFLANGFDDFISKPIDVRHLDTVLNKFVRAKQPQEIIEATRRRRKNAAEETAQSSVSLQLAKFFVRDALKAVAALEVMSEKRGAYTDEDIRMYTTTVHAMKSALANVGESELSAFADKLEQAGLKKEIAVMSSETSAFLSELRAIIAKRAPRKAQVEESEAVDGSYAYLREKLLTVQEACEVINRKAAKDAMSELRQKTWPPLIEELLDTMAEHLLGGDFDEVSCIADRMKNLGSLHL